MEPRKRHTSHREPQHSEEKRFLKAWQMWNRDAVLDLIMYEGPHPPLVNRPPEVSDRDAQVAATVIQWLGTPVGQGFLGSLGYVRERKNHG